MEMEMEVEMGMEMEMEMESICASLWNDFFVRVTQYWILSQ